MRAIIRNLIVIVVGIALWVIVSTVAMFVILRTTSIGRLLIDATNARGDREAISAVVAEYGDPFGLLTQKLPNWLTALAFLVSLLAGYFVGALCSGRSFWVPLFTGLPITVIAVLVDANSIVAWLRACAWGVAAAAATFLVMRWRQRKSDSRLMRRV